MPHPNMKIVVRQCGAVECVHIGSIVSVLYEEDEQKYVSNP